MACVSLPWQRCPLNDKPRNSNSFLVRVPVLSQKMWLIQPSSSGSYMLCTLHYMTSLVSLSILIISTSISIHLDTMILPTSVLIIKSRGSKRISMRKKARKLKPTTELAFDGVMLYWGESMLSKTKALPHSVKIIAIAST